MAAQNARSNERAATTTSLAARTLNVTATTAGDTNESGTVDGNIEASTQANVEDNTVFTAFKLDAEPAENLAAVTMTSPVTNTLQQPLTLNQPLLQRVVVNLLSSLGLGALASGVPSAPVWSPFAMALLGLGSRREFTQPVTANTKTVGTTPVAALTVPEIAAAAVAPTYPGTTRTPVSVSSNTHFIEFVSGAGNLNNTISRFGIGGTDLGIMWDNGIKDDPTTPVDEHQILIAFGDTFSSANPVRTGVWRFNTLFRSADDVLNNGLYVPNGTPYDIFSGSPMEKANWSDPILPSPGQPVRPPYAIGPEVTIIPTAGVSVPSDNAYGARQYMSFMSVRSWDTPGRWTTNYSGIAYSDDNGQTWRIAPTSIRTGGGRQGDRPVCVRQREVPADGVRQAARRIAAGGRGVGLRVRHPVGAGGHGLPVARPRDPDRRYGQVRVLGWQGVGRQQAVGRQGDPARPDHQLLLRADQDDNGTRAVSEMSVQYNPYLKKYVMLYGDSSNQIVMRTADSPEGTWSAPTTLVTVTADAQPLRAVHPPVVGHRKPARVRAALPLLEPVDLQRLPGEVDAHRSDEDHGVIRAIVGGPTTSIRRSGTLKIE